MRIHSLEHVAFEDAAEIGAWARARGHRLTRTGFFAGEALPPLADVDWLVVMGGPMNIYEHDAHPWLAAEKAYLRAALAGGCRVLGVCLGAQLMADVLGGPVTRNADREIGWHPVRFSPAAAGSALFSDFPAELTVFHWHGDTFALPPGAVHLAASDACRNQAFQFGPRAVGLQFHLEYAPASIAAMLSDCAAELQPGGPFIQTPAQMTGGIASYAETCRAWLFRLLERMEQA